MSKTPLLISLIRPTYGKWLLRHYQVTTKNFDIIPKEGPFIVMGNHTHIYDAFFISSAFTQHINWVAGAYLFKNKALNYLLGTLIGGISKQQGKSDLHTITQIRNRLEKKEVVGLFPEGTRTWDGESIPINDATAKLVRIFNVPVVILQVDGGYGSRPRWAKFRRKGPVVLNVVKVVTPEEIAGKRVKEIASLINESLVSSYEQWQKENRVPFASEFRSEGIEQLLYVCPNCHSVSTLKGIKDKIQCSACSAMWTLDDYDFIHSHHNSNNTPETISQWHKWEIDYLKQLSRTVETDQPLFPTDEGTSFQIAHKNRLKELSTDFSVDAYCNKFIINVNTFKRKIESIVESQIEFNFEEISSIAINAKSTLEFTYKNHIYRMRVKKGKSILKYMELFQHRDCERLKESM